MALGDAISNTGHVTGTGKRVLLPSKGELSTVCLSLHTPALTTPQIQWSACKRASAMSTNPASMER